MGTRPGKTIVRGEEQRHAVQLKGVQPFLVRDLTLRNTAGDVLLPGSTWTTAACRSGIVDNVPCEANYRNGLSVTTAADVVFRDCAFVGTAGVDPGARVDLEPNSPTDRLEDPRFIDCMATDNFEGAGFSSPRRALGAPGTR